MLIAPVTRWDIFLRREWRRILFGTIWGLAVGWIHASTGFSTPSYGGVVLGTAIAILLGFRTNGAYERWWEAREIWGSIVNDSRTLTRQLLSFTEGDGAGDRVRAMVHRHILWVWVLGRRMRGHDLLEGMARYATPEERDLVATRSNANTAIMSLQARDLAALRSSKALPDRIVQSVDETLSRLTDAQGGCERIKNTVFPLTYTTVLVWCIHLFYFLTPLSVVDEIGFWAVPFTLLLGGLFGMIEDVSEFIQNPLDDILSGTPMYAISRTIEIDLLEALGEAEVPAPMEPSGVALT